MLASMRYILLCAMRDRLFSGVVALILLAGLIAGALGHSAFLEEQEMTVVLAAAASRMILAVGLIVFVCFHVKSAFDNREIEVMLSRPLSRASLLLAYFLGFSAIACMLVAATALMILFIGPLNSIGYFYWAASLLLESLLNVAIALFAALLLGSAVMAVMTSLGFYVLSRMIIYFLMTAEHVQSGGDAFIMIGKYSLQAVGALIPRLDLFAKTEWLVYGPTAGEIPLLFVGQTAIFLPLLLVAALVDFKRKEF